MIELIAMCAPDVAPQTVQEIIRVESSGRELAMNINKLPGQSTAPRAPIASSPQEAAEIALRFIQAGHSVDMGLMQVNSNNLDYLGISLEDIDVLFTPCANIQAGATILMESYERAAREFGEGQTALQAALSAYNTGNFKSGFSNGYVARYLNAPSSAPESDYSHVSYNPQYASNVTNHSTKVDWTPPENYYVEVGGEVHKVYSIMDELAVTN